MGNRRLALAVGTLAALALATLLTPRRALADEPLTEDVARRLRPEAAQLDSPEAWSVVVALGARVTPQDLRAAETFSLPYAAVIVSERTWPEGVENDFRLAPSKTLSDMTTAMNGGQAVERLESSKGMSLLRAEYIRRVAVKQAGNKATGEVDFEAPGVYRGHLVFEALLAAGTWHITTFEFPATGMRIRWSWGKWVEARMPSDRPPVRLPVVFAAGPLPNTANSIEVVVTPRAVFVGGEEQTTFGALDQSL